MAKQVQMMTTIFGAAEWVAIVLHHILTLEDAHAPGQDTYDGDVFHDIRRLGEGIKSNDILKAIISNPFFTGSWYVTK